MQFAGVNDGSGILFRPERWLSAVETKAEDKKDIANSVLKRPKYYKTYLKFYNKIKLLF